MKRISYKCNYCGSSEHKKLYDFTQRNRTFSVVQCNCGLIFQNPRPGPEELDRYYDEDYFGSDRKEFTSWKEFPDNLEDHVIDMPEMDLGKKGRFLDIGCGIGVYVAYMKSRGWEASGLDVSGYSVELGRKKRGLDLFRGTLEDAEYPAEHFDAVYMRDVIEHLSEPLGTLKEVTRILKPEGWLYLTTGNAGSIVSRLRRQHWFYLQGDHIHYFSLSSLDRMLRRAGLKIVKLGTEYPYGRSISELKRRNAPRLPIRIGEYILNTSVAPFMFRKFGTKAAEPFAQTMSLHIRKLPRI